ncbi:MAG: PQQ-binding-like beta-propeller repeat protein, partial [Planctomycetales bacterium]
MKTSTALLAATFLAAMLIVSDSATLAADWPMWRNDAGRGASSAQALPAQLHPQWSLELGALQPAWPEDVRLQFDAHYEPIVLGKTMFIASGKTDSVTAVHTETGAEAWRFFAGGPVRFAPVAWEGKVYFGSDDGCLYCLDADGALRWKFDAAPNARRVIGNDRLVSVWPVRGGPLVVKDSVYFTSGVWPFEGTMLHELDAVTGKQRNVVNLKDLAPQGYLAASDGKVFIPCGRANARCIDLETLKPVSLRYSAKGQTDWRLSAGESWLFHAGKVLDVSAGRLSKLSARHPVYADGNAYFASGGAAQAHQLRGAIVETKDRKGNVVKTSAAKQLWRLAGQRVTAVHLKAGNRVYGHHLDAVFAIDADAATPKVSWTAKVDGTPATMLAADGKLFVVTKEGSIHCFGAKQVAPRKHVLNPSPLEKTTADDTAAAILKNTGVRAGYCVAIGLESGDLVESLLRQSELRVIAVDPSAAKIERLRKRFFNKGVDAARFSAHVGDPLRFRLPPYLADLVVVENPQAAVGGDLAAKLFQTLRPYGGALCAKMNQAGHDALSQAAAKADLPNAEIKRAGELTLLTRVGALPGAADWTHEYSDPANTLRSRDRLVKAPLGVLWFGGPSADGSLYFDRHKWGPSLTTINGRMFIQGPGKLTAVDVYTGRILWQNKIPDGNSPGRRANWSATGFHLIAAEDSVYLSFPKSCLRLDPVTGKQLSEFKLPNKDDEWGRPRIYKDQMIVPIFGTVKDHGKQPKQLAALNRLTGEVLWTMDALPSFPRVAIGNNKVFVYEGLLDGLYVGADKRRKGGIPQANEFLTIRALDVRTGKEQWSRSTTRVASWLAYSEEHDVLLTANKTGLSAWKGKNGN